jgi:hypothetical protein
MGSFKTYHPVPPVPPRALDAEGVAAVDAMHLLGVPQRRIAVNLDIHWRTVHNVVHRKGAYATTPPPAPVNGS